MASLEQTRVFRAARVREPLDEPELRARIGRLAPESVLDLRDLPAPEPMEKILAACARLAPADALAARTPRLPQMLMSLLDRRGLLWAALEEADGTGLVWVECPAADESSTR